MSALRDQLNQAVKAAMKAKEKDRLTTLRMATAALKQIEVDERITPDDTRIIAVLDKMMKQRKDAAQQFTDGNREDLAEKERFEITVLQEFMPKALTEDELNSLIDAAIESTGAAGMQDMGKVMGILKPQIQGKADMGNVSKQIKTRLG
ncbi:glutamyl-tRNA amidotransferase [Gammaproteobacteria bacterium 45_16_T64]|nr:glutamyl-tRNA amidotransferase [Gammaproteobacteria bacterium 45_16_T64]